MTPNELLLWLSARKQGSWAQFRGAIENLDLAEAGSDGAEDGMLPLHQRVRQNLERLGHVEFDAEECSDGWRVVPPALALCQHLNEATGVLCGARTRKLLENFEQGLNGITPERVSHTDCPDVVRIRAGESQILQELARNLGIRFQADTPTALLSRLPQVDSPKAWKREDLPASGKDWDIKHFLIERKTMKWQPISLQEANAGGIQGLLRFTRFQTPQYFLREGRETFTLAGAMGKYYILFRRRRHVLKYDRKEMTLSAPAIFRPPLLTERALILCSGSPPSLSTVHGRLRLTYQDIPEEVAGLAAEVLKQDLL